MRDLILALAVSSLFGVVYVSAAPEKADITIAGLIQQDVLATFYPKGQSILIDIDSEGGIMDVAYLTIDKIKHMKEAGIVVNCRVTGKAWSAALAILSACSRRTYLPGATLLLHEVKLMFNPGVLIGVKDLLAAAEDLQNANRNMLDLLFQSMGAEAGNKEALALVMQEGKVMPVKEFLIKTKAPEGWIKGVTP